MQHVQALARRDTHARPLADRKRSNARVGPHHSAVRPLDRSGNERSRRTLAQELAIVARGEADIHALGLRGCRETKPGGDRASLGFVAKLPNRELEPG